jgi:hypothetical protein
VTEIPSEPQAHGVRIDSQLGHASISLDGTPMPPGTITGYTLQHDIAGGVLPLVVLHTRQPAGAAFEGLARVAVADPRPASAVIREFLASIDAEALENAALNRDDLRDGRYDLTRAMLRQLADAAREEP